MLAPLDLILATLALSGTVVDAAGAPIEGAETCLVTQGEPVLCVATDAHGFWRLTDTAGEEIRISKSGYLLGTLPPVSPEAPIVLKRAASLRVRVVDRAGAAVESGTLTLVYASGRKIGPLPFNRAGLLNPSLPPGAVRVTADAKGFTLEAPVAATLEAGRNHEIVVRMTRR